MASARRPRTRIGPGPPSGWWSSRAARCARARRLWSATRCPSVRTERPWTSRRSGPNPCRRASAGCGPGRRQGSGAPGREAGPTAPRERGRSRPHPRPGERTRWSGMRRGCRIRRSSQERPTPLRSARYDGDACARRRSLRGYVRDALPVPEDQRAVPGPTVRESSPRCAEPMMSSAAGRIFRGGRPIRAGKRARTRSPRPSRTPHWGEPPGQRLNVGGRPHGCVLCRHPCASGSLLCGPAGICGSLRRASEAGGRITRAPPPDG